MFALLSAAVLALVGMMMTVGSVNILGQGQKAFHVAAQTGLAVLDAACVQYKSTTGTVPPNLGALGTLVVPSTLVDPWGKPYIYVKTPTGWTLSSAGEDGVRGTADDIELKH